MNNFEIAWNKMYENLGIAEKDTDKEELFFR